MSFQLDSGLLGRELFEVSEESIEGLRDGRRLRYSQEVVSAELLRIWTGTAAAAAKVWPLPDLGMVLPFAIALII